MRMLWGGEEDGRFDLYIIDRDSESKHGHSIRYYPEILKDQLPKYWISERIFMDDSTPLHAANAVKKRDDAYRITL